MHTRNTAVRVHSVPWCVKIEYRTRTRVTRFGNTTGIPIPMRNPIARAKVEAKQATKQAEYAYKMQKMLDKKERHKEKNEERAEKMRLLRLQEEQGLGMGGIGIPPH